MYNKFKYKSRYHKVLSENIGSKISDILYNNVLANVSPRTREIKEKMNKWDLIKIKSFCTAKETTIKMKREPPGLFHLA